MWYDIASGVMLIDGLAPFPARSLVATLAEPRIRIETRAGYVIANLHWGDVANASGSGFASGAAAIAYVAGELAKAPLPGNPTRFDVSAAATWILPHGLGRVPIVQVFLASGEQVGADVVADASIINVTFANPTAGFVLAS